MSDLILIDSSNFIFWRYTATKAWWSHSKQGEPEDCHIDNELFVEKYTKHFNDTLTKIKKKFKKFKHSQIIWCCDTPRQDLWRTELDQDYKGTRDNSKCPEIGAFFQFTYSTLINKYQLISCDMAEADDCVGVICHHLHNTNPDLKITIISNDTDFLQLVNSNIQLIKPSKLVEVPLKCESGEEYLQMKVILGDKSDNIPKLFKGCGPKKAKELITDSRAFELEIRNIPERWQQYQYNLSLISFQHIPQKLKDNIIRKFNNLEASRRLKNVCDSDEEPEPQPKVKPIKKIELKTPQKKPTKPKITLKLCNK